MFHSTSKNNDYDYKKKQENLNVNKNRITAYDHILPDNNPAQRLVAEEEEEQRQKEAAQLKESRKLSGEEVQMEEAEEKVPETNTNISYYNLSGRLVKQTGTGEKKMLVLTREKKAEKVDLLITEGKVIDVPPMEVVEQMEKVFEKTESNGNEHGFRVGQKGTLSQIVEGDESGINSEQWKPAVKDLTSKNDYVSYDVHSHPLTKDKYGNVTEFGKAEPGPTDLDNVVGDKPNIVLGYKKKSKIDTNISASSSLGSPQDYEYVKYISYFNKDGILGEQVKFLDYIFAVKRANRK